MKEDFYKELKSLLKCIEYLYVSTGVFITITVIDLDKVEGLIDIIALLITIGFGMIFWLPLTISSLVSKVL
ncbi:hypothetical protein [Senegalia massiliensis]|uniref:Uncharacterized protein n=1 Tax=Senegalia massiliensis TaxID=1720316 RepID=A0A845QXA3_9CLOT|nr:hypothetical protein [Senegalia massiliensis]NBI05778.1 hypothetical protein [Senegalia massiliensis]